jgi:hypothetical protein
MTPTWTTRLYASTAFAYRPTYVVAQMLCALVGPQIAVPAARPTGAAVRRREERVRGVRVLEENVYTCPHLPFTRGKR